ncbi:MAG: beta-ketoacyl-ACP synthase III [Parvularculales bacterium]
MKSSVIKGMGAHVPGRVITNKDLEKMVDTSDEWIVSRSGISRRHIVSEGEYTSDLALAAAQQALENAGMESSDIDAIIVGTTSPDYTLPSTAAVVQRELGVKGCAAFDVQAACSGFIYGLTIADSFLKTGSMGTALVIGAETLSRIVDWEDRSTCVLFGDGAGAAVVCAEEPNGTGTGRQGILHSQLLCDGGCAEFLRSTGGPSRTRTVGYITMDGPEIFRRAISYSVDTAQQLLDEARLSVADIDWFIPHQSNRRIMDGIIKRLDMPESKLIENIADYGNTSAASVPIAMTEAIGDGRIKKGDLLLLSAVGSGLTWAALLMRW